MIYGEITRAVGPISAAGVIVLTVVSLPSCTTTEAGAPIAIESPTKERLAPPVG